MIACTFGLALGCCSPDFTCFFGLRFILWGLRYDVEWNDVNLVGDAEEAAKNTMDGPFVVCSEGAREVQEVRGYIQQILMNCCTKLEAKQ